MGGSMRDSLTLLGTRRMKCVVAGCAIRHSFSFPLILRSFFAIVMDKKHCFKQLALLFHLTGIMLPIQKKGT